MKKIKKLIFVQDCAQYKCEFVVSLGYTYEEIIKYAKKEKFEKFFLENMAHAKENYWESVYGKKSFVCIDEEKSHPFCMILKEFKDEWEFYEILMHECLHIVQAIVKSCQMHKEDESEAYLLEYLFRSIRRKLQGVDKP